MAETPYAATRDGVRLYVRVTPGAKTTAFDGVQTDAAGRTQLRLRVTAAPEKGRANVAAIKLLAKSLKLPRSAISLVAGETSRDKTILIAGAASDLLPRLDHWIKRLSGEG